MLGIFKLILYESHFPVSVFLVAIGGLCSDRKGWVHERGSEIVSCKQGRWSRHWWLHGGGGPGTRWLHWERVWDALEAGVGLPSAVRGSFLHPGIPSSGKEHRRQT